MIEWRKSSHSGGDSDPACVEWAESVGGVWVRDSKDPNGARLEFERASFAGLLVRVKRGEAGL
ncbi:MULTISPECIES: DUF397 domain-containing protein [Thermomonosporaceae]|uniref:DUF397 domain-containing protein n=1 Tax=Thermomonosporaceae TaxID=2012 RepID=UPI00255AF0D4|nr:MULTISPECIES: DUF397 domain-containing protein [Thermomonosporaceae]MDL4772131.1 DUF397 domain-containing protein [Actinomadura xylanilytica]